MNEVTSQLNKKIKLTTDRASYLISILLVTYNHENHIRQALDSLLGQLIEGPIELIVADDASSDNTLAIIRGYEGRDERFTFKYLDNTKNLGITKNYQRGFSACSGEYVAVLEGDDYWVSPLKLQRQTQILDTHWEAGLCSVNYFVYDERHSNFYPRTTIGNGHRLISSRDLIADNLVGNFSTCMYRKTALNALPSELFDIRSYDWIVNICVAETGMIAFLEEPMSVYRLHADGVWSQTSHLEQLKAQLEMIPPYDKLTHHTYHSEFELLSNRIKSDISNIVLRDLAAPLVKSTPRSFHRLADYLPPVLLTITRSLIPPKLMQFFIKRL